MKKTTLPNYLYCFIFLMICFTGCKHDEIYNLFGTWIMDKMEVDDKTSTFPENVKAEMANAPKSTWTFNVDSSVTIKEIGNSQASSTSRFSLSKNNEHTLITLNPGSSPLEVLSINETKMEVSVKSGVLFRMHFIKQKTK